MAAPVVHQGQPPAFVPQAAPTARPIQAHYARPAQPQPMVYAAAAGLPAIDDGGHLLGVSTVLVGVGSMLGIRIGGLYGGVAGALFGGAAVNAYRAVTHALAGTEPGDREARISGTYAVVAAGLGGYVAYKTPGRAKPNRRSTARANTRRSCDIRPV
jgi:hypothetical protein